MTMNARRRGCSTAADKAVAAWCGGAAAEEIDALLNAIPLRSPFKPLRLILKSLISTGDDLERRIRLLDMVPPDSAFGALARAARIAVSGDTLRTIAEWGDLKRRPRGPSWRRPADSRPTAPSC